MAQNFNNKIPSGFFQTVAKFCTLPFKKTIKLPYNVCETKSKPQNKSINENNARDFSDLQPNKMPALCENRLEVQIDENIVKDKFHPIKQCGMKLVEQVSRVPAIVQPFPEPFNGSKASSYSNESTKMKPKSIGNRYKLYSLTAPFHIRQYSVKAPISPGETKKVCKKEELKCKQETEKCKKLKKKCPNFLMPNCECRTVNECVRIYRQPPCTKVKAPYPSYSEVCAEELEPGYSECVKCPWKKCGVDTRNKSRSYHTSSRHFSTDISKDFPKLSPLSCDASKKPCKQPPPKCPQPEEKKEHKPKYPPYKEKEKTRKCKINSAGKWNELFMAYKNKQENIFDFSPLVDVKLEKKFEKFPFDANEADYEHKRKRKCQKEPCGKKKVKKPIVPDCNVPPPCNKEAKTVLFSGGRKGKCPEDNVQHKPPKVDHSIDIKYEMKKSKENDKSKEFEDTSGCSKKPCVDNTVPSTDPCEQKKPHSFRCPKDIKKKIKK